MDPDQERHSVGPDLSPNFLEMLLANDKIRHWQSKTENEYLLEIVSIHYARQKIMVTYLSQIDFSNPNQFDESIAKLRLFGCIHLFVFKL